MRGTESFSIFVAHGLPQEIIEFISFFLLGVKQVIALQFIFESMVHGLSEGCEFFWYFLERV